MKTKAGASMKSSSGSNSAPVVYDWNNDGLLDILTGAEGSLPDNAKAPLLFKNIGTKTKPEFADPVPMTADNTQIVDAERYNIDVADLNYDGKHDFLIGAGWSPSCVYFYENTGTKENPVLKKKVTLQDKSGATIKFRLDLKVYVTDWNEDGGLDLLLGHLDGLDGIDIYLGDVPPTGVVNPGSTAGSYLIKGTIENSFYRTNVHLIEPDRVLLQVFSTNGRVIGSTPVGNLPAGTNYIRYNMGEYPAGSYFINIIAGEKSIGQDPVLLIK